MVGVVNVALVFDNNLQNLEDSEKVGRGLFLGRGRGGGGRQLNLKNNANEMGRGACGNVFQFACCAHAVYFHSLTALDLRLHATDFSSMRSSVSLP